MIRHNNVTRNLVAIINQADKPIFNKCIRIGNIKKGNPFMTGKSYKVGLFGIRMQRLYRHMLKIIKLLGRYLCR